VMNHEEIKGRHWWLSNWYGK